MPRTYLMGSVVFFLIASASGGSMAEAPHPQKTELATAGDPAEWRGFQWGATKEQAQLMGAQPCEDGEGIQRVGLPE